VTSSWRSRGQRLTWHVLIDTILAGRRVRGRVDPATIHRGGFSLCDSANSVVGRSCWTSTTGWRRANRAGGWAPRAGRRAGGTALRPRGTARRRCSECWSRVGLRALDVSFRPSGLPSYSRRPATVLLADPRTGAGRGWPVAASSCSPMPRRRPLADERSAYRGQSGLHPLRVGLVGPSQPGGRPPQRTASRAYLHQRRRDHSADRILLLASTFDIADGYLRCLLSEAVQHPVDVRRTAPCDRGMPSPALRSITDADCAGVARSCAGIGVPPFVWCWEARSPQARCRGVRRALPARTDINLMGATGARSRCSTFSDRPAVERGHG
jgi:hypothetical protein